MESRRNNVGFNERKQIKYDDFDKVELKVAEVIDCKKSKEQINYCNSV